MWRDFLQDLILLGQTELTWVSDCSGSFFRHSWIQPPKFLDKTTLSQITPAQLIRKAATVRNTQVTLSGKTPMELALWRRPRDLMDPASMNPEQLTYTPTKQDLLNEEIQKLVMRTHLQVQQRKDIRRDLAERRKFVLPDLRGGERWFYWQEDPSKIKQRRKSGKWLKVEIFAVKGLMVIVNTDTSILQVHARNLRRPLDTVDLEEPPDSCERTGAPLLWRSCEGRTDVWELFSDNSYLSAILDRTHGLTDSLQETWRTSDSL